MWQKKGFNFIVLGQPLITYEALHVATEVLSRGEIYKLVCKCMLQTSASSRDKAFEIYRNHRQDAQYYSFSWYQRIQFSIPEDIKSFKFRNHTFLKYLLPWEITPAWDLDYSGKLRLKIMMLLYGWAINPLCKKVKRSPLQKTSVWMCKNARHLPISRKVEQLKSAEDDGCCRIWSQIFTSCRSKVTQVYKNHTVNHIMPQLLLTPKMGWIPESSLNYTE